MWTGDRTMNHATRHWALPLLASIAVSSCAAAHKPSEPQGHSYAGWYTEHAGRGAFQPCGKTPALLVGESAELRAEAKKFDLDQDTPVYVRLSGVVSAERNEMSVTKVEQFGSPTPVRDCPMSGLQIQSAAPGGN